MSPAYSCGRTERSVVVSSNCGFPAQQPHEPNPEHNTKQTTYPLPRMEKKNESGRISYEA